MLLIETQGLGRDAKAAGGVGGVTAAGGWLSACQVLPSGSTRPSGVFSFITRRWNSSIAA